MRLRLPRALTPTQRSRLRLDPSGNRLIAGSLGLAIVLGVALVLPRSGAAPAPVDFGTRVPGQRIYDRTGLLSSADLMSVDRRAATIERAGIPVVVFVRPAGPGSDKTRDDASALMRSWGVETRPGAADGLVLFLDVDRQDIDADHVALVAGDQLTKDRFPDREAERISMDSVKGRTTVVDTSRELATTINFNLAATERRLLLGFPTAPPPSTAERTVATFARYLIPTVSVVLASLAFLVIGLIWRGRPRPVADAASPRATDSGILRAALAANRIDQSVILAAVTRLAQQGAIALSGPDPEPGHPGSRHVRLIERALASDDLDRIAWDELAGVAVAGTVDQHGLALIARRPGPFSHAVRLELERRGWWDAMAPRRAVPLVMMSQGLLAAGGVTLVVALAVGEVWALLAIALLVLTASVAWVCSRTYPRATPLGLAVVRHPDRDSA